MKRTLLAVGLVALGFLAMDLSVAAAGTNDHFTSRRRAAALAQQQAARSPWGGPTTGQNWWTPTRHYNYRVAPGTFIFNPGYGGYYNYPRPVYYYGPQYYFPGQHIHIERRIVRP